MPLCVCATMRHHRWLRGQDGEKGKIKCPRHQWRVVRFFEVTFFILGVVEVQMICSARVAFVGKSGWDMRPTLDNRSASSLPGTSPWDGTLTERRS